MKRFLSNLFSVNKTEKLSEKSITKAMVSSVVGMLLCVMALFSLTYAWYTDSVSTNGSTLTAATFSIDVQLSRVTNGARAVETPVEFSPTGEYTLAKGVYKAELTAYGTSKYGGYAVINNGEEVPYHTIVMTPVETENTPSKLTVMVYVAADNTVVKFSSLWGKSPVLSDEIEDRDSIAKLITEVNNIVGGENNELMNSAPVQSQSSTDNTTVIPDDTTVTPDDTEVTPDDTTVTPDDTTVTPDDTTVTPDDTTVIE